MAGVVTNVVRLLCTVKRLVPLGGNGSAQQKTLKNRKQQDKNGRYSIKINNKD